MNIANKDLNLLLAFHVLDQERNASLAAARMALSQPALSHKLNKLRHEFGDPLFVRAPRGLASAVQRLVGELEAFYEHCEGRDFLARGERIHLYTTDFIEQTLLPRLLPQLRQQIQQVAGQLEQEEGTAETGGKRRGTRHSRVGIEKARSTWLPACV